MNRRILMVACEASGDLHGAYVAQALRALDPTLSLIGLGGKAMQAAGVDIRLDASEVGIVGVTELLSRLPVIRAAYRTVTRILQEEAPALVLLIDCPGFNLRVAAVAKRLGLPVVYYIAPQAWAWRPQRLATIRRLVDRLLVVLPFEEAFFREAGVSCEFVGHPLLDEMGTPEAPESARRRLGLAPRQPIVGLLPGSRSQEVARHLPLMLDAAGIMSRELPGLHAVLAVAPTVSREAVKLMVDRLSPIEVRVVVDEAGACLAASDVAIVASGTSTLQAALTGTPMVIIYRLSPLTYLIARRLVRVPHISLVNLIAGNGVVPELIQGAATPQAIAAHVLRLFQDPAARARAQHGLEEVRRRVGGPGASARAARLIVEEMIAMKPQRETS